MFSKGKHHFLAIIGTIELILLFLIKAKRMNLQLYIVDVTGGLKICHGVRGGWVLLGELLADHLVQVCILLGDVAAQIQHDFIELRLKSEVIKVKSLLN